MDDNKLPIYYALAGALFGAVATWAYASTSYQLVPKDKYEQLLRGAGPVPDPARAPLGASPQVNNARLQGPAPGETASHAPQRPDSADPNAKGPPPSTAPETFDFKGSPTLGPDNAKVTVVEFADFQCEACAFWASGMKKLLSAHDGQVRIVFKNAPLPIHANARHAAYAGAAAAKQGKFWQLADVLFHNQGALGEKDVLRYAEQVGLNLEKFKKDIEAQDVHDLVDRDWGEAERSLSRSGAKGVPAFFVNGHFADVSSPEQLGELIDRAQ